MLNKKRVIEVRWTMENDSDTVKGPTEPHPHSPLHTYYVRHSATEWIPITIIITLQIFLISDFTQLSLPLSSSSPFLFSFNYYYPVLTLLSLSYSQISSRRKRREKKEMVYCAISGVRFPCLPSVYNTKSQSSFNGDPLCRKGLSFFSKKDPSSCNSPFYFSAKGFAFYFSIYIYIYKWF